MSSTTSASPQKKLYPSMKTSFEIAELVKKGYSFTPLHPTIKKIALSPAVNSRGKLSSSITSSHSSDQFILAKTIEKNFLPKAQEKIEKSIRETFSHNIVRMIRRRKSSFSFNHLRHQIDASHGLAFRETPTQSVKCTYILEFAPQERLVSFEGKTFSLPFPWIYMSIDTSLSVRNKISNNKFLSYYYYDDELNSNTKFSSIANFSPLEFECNPDLLYFSPCQITDLSTQSLYAPWVPNVYRGGTSGERDWDSLVLCLPPFPHSSLTPVKTKRGPSFNATVVEQACSAFGLSASRLFTMDFNFDNMQRIKQDSPKIWALLSSDSRSIFKKRKVALEEETQWCDFTLSEIMSIEKEKYGKPISTSALFGRAKNARDKLANKKDLP